MVPMFMVDDLPLPLRNAFAKPRSIQTGEPNPNKLDDEGMCTVELEKEFRDVCFSVLAKWSKLRKAEDQCASWISFLVDH